MSIKKSMVVVGVFALFAGLTPAYAAPDSNNLDTKTVQAVSASLRTAPVAGTVLILDKDGTEKLQFSASGSLGETFETHGLQLSSYRTDEDAAVDEQTLINPRKPIILFEKGVENLFETIILEFQKEEIQDPELLIGMTEVEQEGVNGVAVKTTISVNSQTSETSEETITVLKSPVTKVTRVGTKKVTLDNLPKVWKTGDYGIADNTKKLRAALFAEFPELNSIGGFRNCDYTGEHCTGRALDIMIPNYKNNQQLGTDISAWLIQQTDAGVLDTCWIIWQQGISKSSTGWQRVQMENRGNDVTNHFDHVHVFMKTSTGACTTQPSTH